MTENTAEQLRAIFKRDSNEKWFPEKNERFIAAILEVLIPERQAIVQPLKPNCPTCMDGTMPGETRRTGRATWLCAACCRDVSLAVIFLSDDEDAK